MENYNEQRVNEFEEKQLTAKTCYVYIGEYLSYQVSKNPNLFYAHGFYTNKENDIQIYTISNTFDIYKPIPNICKILSNQGNITTYFISTNELYYLYRAILLRKVSNFTKDELKKCIPNEKVIDNVCSKYNISKSKSLLCIKKETERETSISKLKSPKVKDKRSIAFSPF